MLQTPEVAGNPEEPPPHSYRGTIDSTFGQAFIKNALSLPPIPPEKGNPLIINNS